MTIEKEVSLLRKQLEILHLIDDIRDKYEDLRDILKYGLKNIANIIDAKIAFIQYENIYNEKKTIAIDKKGIRQRDMFDIIDQLAITVKKSGKKVIENFHILSKENNYIALEMKIGDKFIGIIGIGKVNDILEEDIILLKEASSILDTAINNDGIKEFEKDKNKIVENIDNIFDEYSSDFNISLEKVVNYLVEKFDSAAVLIFGVDEEEFIIKAANHAGRIIWENYESVKFKMMEIIQICLDREIYTIFNIDKNQEEFNIAGKKIKCIAGYPLCTSGGDIAGTMVVLSNRYLSTAYEELIKAAASQIDTAIINERRIKMMVKRFNKYVGMEIVDVLLKNPEWLNPRKENILVISVDLVGSTEFAHNEPDAFKVFFHINKYLGLIGKIIKNDFHGTLDKYIGDEVMGIFGAPVKDINCAFNGVNCAFNIIDRVNSYNKELEKKNEQTFKVKITMGLVDAVAGEVGSEDTQTDYTVIGGGVSEVFRIAKYTEPEKIYINENLYNKIKNNYSINPIGRREARGIKDGLMIYELIKK